MSDQFAIVGIPSAIFPQKSPTLQFHLVGTNWPPANAPQIALPRLWRHCKHHRGLTRFLRDPPETRSPRFQIQLEAWVAKGFQDKRYRQLIEQLIEARKRAGHSQEHIARLLGTHQQFVSRYETGERRLDAIELIDVARALGLNPIDLISQF